MEIQQRKNLLGDELLTISCVVPTYNEGESIAVFIDSLINKLSKITRNFEIIVINDGSADNTIDSLGKFKNIPQVKIISFSRNFGKEAALSAGISHSQGDVTILIDSDFQHPIDLIDSFLASWAEGYDMVYGVRQNRQNEARIRRFFTRGFYKLIDLITPITIPQNAGDYRLLDRKVINALNTLEERERFMKGLYAWVGFKSHAIPFHAPDRVNGKSSWKFKNLFELALTGIASFSNVPLRVWSLVGFSIALVSFIYAVWIIFHTLMFGADLPGYATIVVAIMFFGGVQLLSIGILGEYVARIFNEVKQRPRYIIERKDGFDE
jgi:glycosyltransferase involved in cell wall biosynthesis